MRVLRNRVRLSALCFVTIIVWIFWRSTPITNIGKSLHFSYGDDYCPALADFSIPFISTLIGYRNVYFAANRDSRIVVKKLGTESELLSVQYALSRFLGASESLDTVLEEKLEKKLITVPQVLSAGPASEAPNAITSCGNSHLLSTLPLTKSAAVIYTLVNPEPIILTGVQWF